MTEITSAPSGNYTIKAPDGAPGVPGSTITLTAGSASTDVGGNVDLEGGDSVSNDAGRIQLTAGTTNTGFGGSISLFAGTGEFAGGISLSAGVATGSGEPGGDISVSAGNASVNGDGGSVFIVGGTAGTTSGNGGGVGIEGGPTFGNGNGGGVSIAGANAAGTNKDGGSVDIFIGSPTGTGSRGSINLYSNQQTQTAELRFVEALNNGTNFVALKAPTLLGANITLTLPSTAGLAGQALTSDGFGVLSFTNVSVTAAYDVAGSVLGLPAAGITVFKFAVGRAFTLNPTGSVHVALANTNPASGSTATFTIQRRPIGGGAPTTLGTMTFAPAALTGTVTFSFGTNIAMLVGQEIEIVYTTQDSGALLGFISFTFQGQI